MTWRTIAFALLLEIAVFEWDEKVGCGGILGALEGCLCTNRVQHRPL